MCWFAGFTFNDRSLLESMWQSLKPRAVDKEYFHIDDDISFYHAHLSIEDLDKDTSQPLIYKNLIIWLVWEIYNKNFLLNLVWRKWEFTELEVIALMYESYWKKFIDYINWEFAIFIFDKKKNTYLLYRDRWGTNNIYYHIKGDKLYFASELKSLILNKPRVNKNAFVEFMTFQFCISPNTIVEGIKTLRPGTYLEFLNWKIELNDFEPYIYQDVRTNLIDTLEQSVIRRIPHHQRRIFLSLSWWPDSNLLLFFLKKHYKGEIIAYSFETKKNEKEISIAKVNAKKMWIVHLIINMDNFKYENYDDDIYTHEWLVKLPNLEKIIRKNYPEYASIKVEFWWDWKEELILWNNHFPYKEIISRYKYFKEKKLIKNYNITQEFLNKEMFDYNLQMIDKVTLRNGIERRMPFTDYELWKFFNYKNYSNEAKKFLNSHGLSIVDWEYGYNLGIGFKNLYDLNLLDTKKILFKKMYFDK